LPGEKRSKGTSWVSLSQTSKGVEKGKKFGRLPCFGSHRDGTGGTALEACLVPVAHFLGSNTCVSSLLQADNRGSVEEDP